MIRKYKENWGKDTKLCQRSGEDRKWVWRRIYDMWYSQHPFAVRRHHGQGSSYINMFTWGWVSVSEDYSLITKMGNMTGCRQTCFWRSSWEHCIQQDEKDTSPDLGFLNLEAQFQWQRPLTRSQDLILLKQLEYLMNKPSKRWAFEGLPYSTH